MDDLEKPKATAKAPAKPKPRTIEISGAHIVPMKAGDKTEPSLVFKGDVPATGDTLVFSLDNRVTYTGKVDEAIEADGEVVVSFKDGITPK